MSIYKSPLLVAIPNTIGGHIIIFKLQKCGEYSISLKTIGMRFIYAKSVFTLVAACWPVDYTIDDQYNIVTRGTKAYNRIDEPCGNYCRIISHQCGKLEKKIRLQSIELLIKKKKKEITHFRVIHRIVLNFKPISQFSFD